VGSRSVKRKALAALAASTATLLLLGPLGTSQTLAASTSGIPKGPIVIGLPIALTGVINAYDSNVLIGAQTEAKLLNAKGGIDGHLVKLVTADTASNIAQGGAAADQVISEGAEFILPTVDYNFGGGAARVAQAHNLITISAADDTRMGLSIGNDVFNLDVGGGTAGAVLAKYAHDTLKWTKAFVLEDTSIAADSAFGGGFGVSFAALGGKVVNDTYEENTASEVAAVSKVQSAASSVSGVLIAGFPPTGASVLREIRAAGVSLPVLLGDGFDGNFWESAVSNLAHTYVISYGIVTPGQTGGSSAGRALAVARSQGEKVTIALSYLDGFSAVQAIAQGIFATDSVSANKIRPFFESFRNHPLAIGPTTWTRSCHARVGDPMIVGDFSGGLEHYVTTLTATVLPPDACS
jgi:branched-chain amino acid transport system substrate-binding protein